MHPTIQSNNFRKTFYNHYSILITELGGILLKIKIISIIILFILIISMFTPYITANQSQKKTNYQLNKSINLNNSNNNWLQKTQVYDMVALPPEDIEKYHVTVNGLWNGFMGEENLSSPFALGRYLESLYSGELYNSDEQFVNSQHDKGLIVPSTITSSAIS